MNDVHILEHQSATNLPGNTSDPTRQPLPLPPPQPSLHYVHFTSDRIESLLQTICHLLGRHGSLPILIDHLTEQLRSSSSLRGKELLLILAHVILGGAQREKSAESADEMFALVEGLLEELVAPSNWDRSESTLNLDLESGDPFWREERTVSDTKVRSVDFVISDVLSSHCCTLELECLVESISFCHIYSHCCMDIIGRVLPG